MKHPTRGRPVAIGAILTLSLALMGCSTGGDEPPTAATDTASATEDGAADHEVEESPAVPPETPTAAAVGDTAQSEADAAPAATDPAACLQGTWLADNEYFLAGMREFGDEITGVTGKVMITFGEDGSVVTEYQGWRITAQAEGFESVITREGVDRGTYTTDGDRVTIHESDVGSTLTVKAPGMDMPITPEPVDYSQAEYTCDASDARIVTPDGAVILSRTDG